MFARARIANVVSSSLLSRVARRPPRRDAGAMAREASWSDGPDGARRRTPPDAPHGPVVALYDKCVATLPSVPGVRPVHDDHVRAIMPYLEAVTARDLALEVPDEAKTPPSTSTSRLDRAGLRGGGGGGGGGDGDFFRRGERERVGERERERSSPSSSPEPGARRGLEYLHLHEDLAFTLGVFKFLAAGDAIPTHDHPGMTVMSKILYGAVHVKSYDWVVAPEDEGKPPPPVPDGTPRLARVVRDGVVAAGTTPLALFPTRGGNVHGFTAITPTAMLDVQAPPYALGAGRDCHYFHEVSEGPGGEPAGAGYAWLAAAPSQPESFRNDHGTYRGPKFGSNATEGGYYTYEGGHMMH